MTILQPGGTLQIDLPMQAIATLCKKYGVAELALFGSILRDDFRADSDVDILVVFKDDEYGPWMSKVSKLEDELSALLQRKVDLVRKPGVEQSRNWIKRNAILHRSCL